MSKRKTQKDVKKALRNAKRRLKRFLEKNPTTFNTIRINEEALKSLSPSKAIDALSKISVKNVNDNDMYRLLEIISKGTNIYRGGEIEVNVKGTVMKRKLFTAETARVKSYHQLGMHAPKLNLMGQPTKALFSNFLEKYGTPEKILSSEEIRNENALNNYMNNLFQMRDMVENNQEKTLFDIILDLVINKIETGGLTAKELNDKKLFKFSGINLFDSKVLQELRANAKKVLKQLRLAFDISDDEIIDKVYPKFYEELHDELYTKYWAEYEKRFDLSDIRATADAHIRIEEQIKEEIKRRIRNELSRE